MWNEPLVRSLYQYLISDINTPNWSLQYCDISFSKSLGAVESFLLRADLQYGLVHFEKRGIIWQVGDCVRGPSDLDIVDDSFIGVRGERMERGHDKLSRLIN